MKAENRKRVQAFLAIAVVLAGVRVLLIYRGRHAQPAKTTASQATPLKAEYYVTPKKLYPFDLKSARQLAQQPVWIKEGYRYTYYPYISARHSADLDHQAGLLGPLEKLNVKDVVSQKLPHSGGREQLLAIFEKDGKTHAVPIGTLRDGTYQIYSDEMFFIQDPRQLYDAWPTDVWDAITQHQVKPGMDELQATFAIGMGVPERSDDPAVKTVNYPNGGKPIVITYRDGKAEAIKPASA